MTIVSNQDVNGRPATLIYLSGDFIPVEPGEADMIKVIFEDERGGSMFVRSTRKKMAQDYNPQEARDPKGTQTGGRWTKGGATESEEEGKPDASKEWESGNKEAAQGASKSLLERIKEDGGFTYHAVSHDSPKPGDEAFAVSYSKETEKVVPLEKITADDVFDYVVDHWSDLRQADHYVGAWVDNGQVYLDCSIVVKDEAQAIKIAQEHDQLAYFAFKNLETVTTPPKDGKNVREQSHANDGETDHRINIRAVQGDDRTRDDARRAGAREAEVRSGGSQGERRAAKGVWRR